GKGREEEQTQTNKNKKNDRRYQLRVLNKPQQLIEDEDIFYKEVKPKSNYLEYEIGLYDSHNKMMKLTDREIAIECSVCFEDKSIVLGDVCAQMKCGLLQVKSPPIQTSCNGGSGHVYSDKSLLHQIDNATGKCVIPLRVEHTSSKHSDRKFRIRFAADTNSTPFNLDIAPAYTDTFLVRTKINKYRLPGYVEFVVFFFSQEIPL
ncbi:hypothetical protein RFI_07736, partial [Reticulomyxa filosa]